MLERRGITSTTAALAMTLAEQVTTVFGRMRFALDVADRRALLMLLQRGHPGGVVPFARSLDFLEGDPPEATG